MLGGSDNYDSSNVYVGYIDAVDDARATVKTTFGNYTEKVGIAVNSRIGGFDIYLEDMANIRFFRVIGYLK